MHPPGPARPPNPPSRLPPSLLLRPHRDSAAPRRTTSPSRAMRIRPPPRPPPRYFSRTRPLTSLAHSASSSPPRSPSTPERHHRRPQSLSRPPAAPRPLTLSVSSARVDSFVWWPQLELGGAAASDPLRPLLRLSSIFFVSGAAPAAPKPPPSLLVCSTVSSPSSPLSSPRPNVLVVAASYVPEPITAGAHRRRASGDQMVPLQCPFSSPAHVEPA